MTLNFDRVAANEFVVQSKREDVVQKREVMADRSLASAVLSCDSGESPVFKGLNERPIQPL